MSSITVDQYEPNFDGTMQIKKDFRSLYRKHRHLRHLKKCSMMKLVEYKKEANILSCSTTPDAEHKLRSLKSLCLDEVGNINVLLLEIQACRLDLEALRDILNTRRVIPEHFAARAAQALMNQQFPD